MTVNSDVEVRIRAAFAEAKSYQWMVSWGRNEAMENAGFRPLEQHLAGGEKPCAGDVVVLVIDSARRLVEVRDALEQRAGTVWRPVRVVSGTPHLRYLDEGETLRHYDRVAGQWVYWAIGHAVPKGRAERFIRPIRLSQALLPSPPLRASMNRRLYEDIRTTMGLSPSDPHEEQRLLEQELGL